VALEKGNRPGVVGDAFRRLRDETHRISGWRRVAAAFGLGVVAVAALPPIHVWIALIPSFVGFVWLVESSPSRRSSFFTGWWFGFGYFSAGLYWVANAFLTKPEQFGWLAPIAVAALAAIQALFPGVTALLTDLTRARGVGRVLVFAAAWTACEWARSWAFTGFPWNLIGTVWVFSDAMIQVTAVIGTYGLSLLTVAAAAMPATLVDDEVAPRLSRMAIISVCALLLAVWVGGLVRLATIGHAENVPGVRLRLVQPNIPQNIKWKRELLDFHLETQAQMGDQPSAKAPTHVIWSETAAPLILAQDPKRLALIGEFTPANGLTILGTIRQTPPEMPFQVWNSLLVVDSDGQAVAFYDKSHLVPLGEYVPLRSIFNIGKVTAGTTDFSPGTGITTMRLPGLPPVSPLICYEVIFPGEVVDRTDRPEWMLNLTNDGWYGLSSGPYQHFAASRLRATEEGLPLVRAANTGISAIVDPWGRVVARLGLGKKGIVDGPLPVALEAPTVYAKLGNWIVLLVVLVVGGTGLLLSHQSKPLFGE
jgi:apolipoprotein N-acyltransferase